MGRHFIDYWAIYSADIDRFENLGDIDEAVICCEQLLRHFPGLATAWLRYAELLLKAERGEDADRAFERAMKHDALHPPLALSYAARLRDTGRAKQALEILKPILAVRPNWDEAAALACMLLTALKKPAQAIEHAEQFLNLHPDSFVVRLALYRACIAAGDVRAAETLDRCRELARSNPALIEQLAENLFEAGRIEETIALLKSDVENGRVTLRAGKAFAKALDAAGVPAEATRLRERMLQQVNDAELSRDVRAAARESRRPQKKGAKQILMITELPRTREAKLAHALKRVGWDAVLLYGNPPNFDVTRFFTESIPFKTPAHALTIADQLNIPLHHVFALRGDLTSAAFIREKLSYTIFDVVDVYDALIYSDFPFHGLQRECLINADALVCRDLQVQHAAKLGNYDLPRKILYFPEYCWGDPLPPEPPRTPGEIHAVQSGYIDVERYVGAREIGVSGYVEKLAAAGIHVHIYQHVFTRNLPIEDVYRDFIEIGKRTGCVHIHPNVPLDQIINEYGKYDIGLQLLVGEDEPVAESYVRTKSLRHFESCSSARVTDYVEAGLPVVSPTMAKFQNRTIARYGTYIPLTRELLERPREILAPYCTPAIRAANRRKSVGYSLGAHVDRLVKFYERCLSGEERSTSRKVSNAKPQRKARRSR